MCGLDFCHSYPDGNPHVCTGVLTQAVFTLVIIFHLANQSRYINICKAAALQCDSKAAAVSVTSATELLGGNKFFLGLLSLRFSFLLGTIFWSRMVVTM